MTPVTDPNILAQLNSQMPVTDQAILAQLNGDDSFAQNYGNDLAHRGNNAMNILGQGVTGDISLPSTALQLANQGWGGVQDIGKEAAKSAYNSLPDNVTAPVNSAANKLGSMLTNGAQTVAGAIDSTDTGKAIGDALYNHPEAVNNVGALANLSTFQPTMDVLSNGVGSVANAVKNTNPMDMAKNIASGGADVKATAASVIPTSQEVRGIASPIFKMADEAGGTLKPEITDKWVESATNVIPKSEEAKTVFNKLTPAEELAQNIQEMKGKPLSLSGTQEIDMRLGDLAHDNIDPNTGEYTAEGRKYIEIQKGLRAAWDNATENDVVGGKAGFDLVKQGRGLWATAARMNDLERINKRALMNPNPATAMRSGYSSLANNPSRMGGYRPNEISAINRAGNGNSAFDKTLGFAGHRIAAPVIGYALGGPTGAAAGSGIAEASRALQDALKVARGRKALATVASRPELQDPLIQGLLAAKRSAK